ncbi:MAG: flagellar hook-associated protein FlgK [Gammaproteobacteria bacterium]|nr:flagellar hook-associated protein FlgK [Gammaproteobacteria bacterium]
MSGALSIGVSALLANQRQLSTTSHNIANVHTEGYSRQRVEQQALPAQYAGVGFIGKGVDISSISRLADQFLEIQVRNNTAGEARASIYADFSIQVDGIVGDGTFGPALARFFQTLQDVNNDPSSIPAREVFLTATRGLTDRFQDLDSRFSALNDNLNGAISQRVTQLNSYSSALAALNRDIVQAYGTSQGQSPNDLLDQRDRLLKELSKITNISTIEQQDHATNVFLGNGQLLVAAGTNITLAATPNPLDGSRLEVSIQSGGVSTEISSALVTGELAGILAFRDEILDPARNAIGRLAAGLSITMNTRHQNGMDLRGVLGTPLFVLGSANVNAALGNTGSVSMSLDSLNVGNLTDSDYRLVHNGTDFILTRLTDGVQQTLSGTGPFSVDGMTITLPSAPAAGDQYLLQPTQFLARGSVP